MKSDPAIERIRDARREISASLGDDPAKLVEYYIEMQKRFGARLRRGPAGGGEGAAEEGLRPGAHENARR